jgi:hypothetical protein
MKPGILIAPIWPRRLPKSTLTDIKVPALVTPLTPGYTPPDANELHNRRAMNGGKPDQNLDLRGLPEPFRIGGRDRDSEGDR